MLRGFVDLPQAVTPLVLRASGSVRGVFTRPWVSTEEAFPWPDGFSSSSHRVLWTKVSRFSDVLYTTQKQAEFPFDGLVCPRTRGEVGIRVSSTADLPALHLSLQALVGEQVKVHVAGVRSFLRLSGVPLAFLGSLDTVMQALSPNLILRDQRVIRCS
jgi:hypothetical protein